MGARTTYRQSWDAKRVLALSGVFVFHAIVFAVLLLPKQAFELKTPKSQEVATLIEFTEVQPPPRPPVPPPPAPTPAPPQPTTFVPTPVVPSDTREFVAPSISAETVTESNPEETAVDSTVDTGPDGSDPSQALALTKLFAPPPAYPRNEQARRIGGSVEVLVLVGTDGLPLELRIGNSSGNGNFERAALRALKRWRFQPYVKDGTAREVWARVPVVFTVED